MNATTKAQRLFTIEQAAVQLSVSPWTLRRHISELGTVKATRAGRLVRISSEELDRIAAEGLPSLPGPSVEGEQCAKREAPK